MNESGDWQRLSRAYSEMGEVEIEQLRSECDTLTETAQQVLRDELKNRGMAQPGEPVPALADAEKRRRLREREEASDQPEGGAAGEREYTWKVSLREFQTSEEAYLAQRALKAAAIESWVLDPSRDGRMNRGYPLLQVAADQVEEAEQVLAQPIPQDVVDDATIQPQPWEQRVCPKCGAEDPLLEGVDPVNQWACEACGAQWQEKGDDEE